LTRHRCFQIKSALLKIKSAPRLLAFICGGSSRTLIFQHADMWIAIVWRLSEAPGRRGEGIMHPVMGAKVTPVIPPDHLVQIRGHRRLVI
jgi:hypothetical protein